MTSPDPRRLLDGLLSGAISAAEAGRALAGSPSLPAGLDRAASALSPGDRARLDEIMPAVSWELTKILSKGRYPDVPYGSAEHRAIIASATRLKQPPKGQGE